MFFFCFTLANINKSFETSKLNLVGDENFLTLNGFTDNANLDE